MTFVFQQQRFSGLRALVKFLDGREKKSNGAPRSSIPISQHTNKGDR